MSAETHGSLYPEDILNTGQDADAVRQDLHETVQSLDTDMQQKMIESQLAIRAATFGVLALLAERGVDEAEELKEMLEANDPEENPHSADLAGIALEISEAQYHTDDIDEQRRLKTLGSVAHAVSAIATANAVMMHGIDHKNTPALLAAAAGEINGADVSDATRAALRETLRG